MITSKQWEHDRTYISRLRYGIDRYNHVYSNEVSGLIKRYGVGWNRIPYHFSVDQVNEYFKVGEVLE